MAENLLVCGRLACPETTRPNSFRAQFPTAALGRLLAYISLLFDPGRLEGAPGRRRGTPSVPTPSGGRGAQGRSRAAEGRDRTRAQPRAARRASMASTGRTCPLTAPSTVALPKPDGCPRCPRKPPTNYRKPTGYLLPGCPAKCPCFSLQSARAFPCKVPVDNLLIHSSSPLALLPLKAPSRRCQCALSPAAGCAAASSPARPTRCRPPGIGCARPARSAGTRL